MSDLESQVREVLGASVADAMPGFDVVTVVRRRHRRRMARLAAASAAAATAVATTAALVDVSAGAHHARPSQTRGAGHAWPVIRGARVRSVIVIGGGETFAPPPASALPRLTARQAWNASYGRKAGLRDRVIPPYLSYQLGLLTVPPSVTDVLAWGFSSPPGGCPQSQGAMPAAPGHHSSAPVRPSLRLCIAWTFINAGNGSNPSGTWQPLGVRLPTPPDYAVALRSAGFVAAELERFSPQRLVVQAPLSTIRWTFSAPSCSVSTYWFEPPLSRPGPARAACHWRRAFAVKVVTDFAIHGHVLTVVAGYVARYNGQLVRAILADGQTQIYDPRDGNAAWLFVIQRCGDYRGTMPKAIEEITPAGVVIARLPVPATANPATRACR